MSRLLEDNPYSLWVNETEYDIDPSYRAALETFKAFADPELSEMEKAGIMVHNLYLGDEEYSAETFHALVEKAVWFLRCGETEEKAEKKPTINFDFDNRRIYNAFLKMDVNLNKKTVLLDEYGEPELDEDGKKILVYMHWWDFCARLQELPECDMTRIMYLRQLHNSRELYRKEHKSEYKEAQKIGMHIIEMKSSHEILDDYENGIMDAIF